MIDLQKLIVDDIENLLKIEPTKEESNPNLLDVELLDISTDGLILQCKAYIYKSKLKLKIKHLEFMFSNSKHKEKVITIKGSDIPNIYKLKLYYKNNEIIINRCRFDSNFRLSFSESTLMESEPMEVVFLLKEGEDLFCIKS